MIDKRKAKVAIHRGRGRIKGGGTGPVPVPTTPAPPVPPPPPAIPTGWNVLRIGGGGFSRLMDVANDGTMITGVDVYGVYVWRTTTPNIGNDSGSRPFGTWTNMWVPSIISYSDPCNQEWNSNHWIFGSGGAWAGRICKGNSQKLWCGLGGNVYKSTNQGVTLQGATTGTYLTPFGGSNVNPNYPRASGGPYMAVDPGSSGGDRCFVGCAGSISPGWAGTSTALIYTLDGGTTWNAVPTTSVPASNAGGGISSGDPNIMVVFDPSTTSGGTTPGLYAASEGHGFYYSGNSGSTWAALPTTGAPPSTKAVSGGTGNTGYGRIFCDAAGRLWVTTTAIPANSSFVGGGIVYMYSGGGTGGTWSNPIPNTQARYDACWSPAVDPQNTNVIVMGIADLNGGTSGTALYSTAGTGGPWTTTADDSNVKTALDCPYLVNEAYMSLSEFTFDNSHNLWFAEGVGNWVATSLTSPMQFASRTAGIESLESLTVAASPLGGCRTTHWDRPSFTHTVSTLSNMKISYGPNPGALSMGLDSDWGQADPNFGVVANDFSLVFSGYTTNNGGSDGGSWTDYATEPLDANSLGGAVGCTSSGSIVAIQGGSDPFYSTDTGNTWNHIDLSSLGVTTSVKVLTAPVSSGGSTFNVTSTQGMANGHTITNSTNGHANGLTVNVVVNSTQFTTTSGTSGAMSTGDLLLDGNLTSGFHANRFNNRPKLIAASRVTDGTYWIYNDGTGTGAAGTTEGIYRTTNFGASWTQVCTGLFGAVPSSPKLKAVNVSGVDHLWFASVGGNNGLYKCTSPLVGSISFTQIPNLTIGGGGFGFGPTKGGASYPSLAVQAIISSLSGVNMLNISDDGGSTFTQYPNSYNNFFDDPNDTEYDKTIYGLVYMTMNQSGAIFYKTV